MKPPKNKKNTHTREKKKDDKKKTQTEKKTRPSKTWSISILTYDMTISDENSQNVVST